MSDVFQFVKEQVARFGQGLVQGGGDAAYQVVRALQGVPKDADLSQPRLWTQTRKVDGAASASQIKRQQFTLTIPEDAYLVQVIGAGQVDANGLQEDAWLSAWRIKDTVYRQDLHDSEAQEFAPTFQDRQLLAGFVRHNFLRFVRVRANDGFLWTAANEGITARLVTVQLYAYSIKGMQQG